MCLKRKEVHQRKRGNKVPACICMFSYIYIYIHTSFVARKCARSVHPLQSSPGGRRTNSRYFIGRHFIKSRLHQGKRNIKVASFYSWARLSLLLFFSFLNAADVTVCCTQIQIRNHCTMAQPVGPFSKLFFYHIWPALPWELAPPSAPPRTAAIGKDKHFTKDAWGRVQRELKKLNTHRR